MGGKSSLPTCAIHDIHSIQCSNSIRQICGLMYSIRGIDRRNRNRQVATETSIIGGYEGYLPLSRIFIREAIDLVDSQCHLLTAICGLLAYHTFESLMLPGFSCSIRYPGGITESHTHQIWLSRYYANQQMVNVQQSVVWLFDAT